MSNVCDASENRTQLLDFGCGNWRSPLKLARKGFTVTGLDVFSPKDLAEFSIHLPGFAGAGLVAYNGLTPLPFGNESFEIISSLCVFEHLLAADSVLNEFNRILKPGGRVVIQSPNWAGPNNCVRAILVMLGGGERYFHYETIMEAVKGLGRCLILPLWVKMKRDVQFVYIFPRLNDGHIEFQTADDDAVHLCVPTSFKKWFRRNGFQIVSYNKHCGSSTLVRLFNRIVPWYATTNLIIAEKA